MKKVLVISDGRPGHYNQSLAVANAINSLFPVEIKIMGVQITKPRRFLLRSILNRKTGQRWIKYFANGKTVEHFYGDYLDATYFDIIVSSGKDTSLLNAMLTLMQGNINIFIGNPKKLDNKLFTAVLTILDLGFDNQILLNVAPTNQTDVDFTTFANRFHLDKNKSYKSLLIGGDGSGYIYTEVDIKRLISYVNNSFGSDWLVTTSRRTAINYAEMLEKEMRCKCFIPYHKNPENVIPHFLELSNSIFVTEDSASMISEAVAARKPVFSLIPDRTDVNKNYEAILNQFKNKKLIQRLRINSLNNSDVGTDGFECLTTSSRDELACKLKKLF